MDITYISDNIFKIKGKTGVAIVDEKGQTIESPKGEKMTFTGPGEYEVSGISIINLKIETGDISILEVDKLRICYIDNSTKKLPENKLSLLGNIDVLLLSVGKEDVEIVQQLESYYVIPFGYDSQESLDSFLKASGLVVEKMLKFSLKKEELIEDSPTQIIVLGKN